MLCNYCLQRYYNCSVILFALIHLQKHEFVGSSRPEMFCKKGILRNIAKFSGKHLCQSLFFNKLKKRLWHRCFLVSFVKFLRAPLFTEHLWWLLLICVTKTYFQRDAIKFLRNILFVKKIVVHQKIKIVSENLISMIYESFILELWC